MRKIISLYSILGDILIPYFELVNCGNNDDNLDAMNVNGVDKTVVFLVRTKKIKLSLQYRLKLVSKILDCIPIEEVYLQEEPRTIYSR